MGVDTNIAKNLIQGTGNLLEIVYNYQPQEMKKVFAKLAALEAALKAADMFNDASIQFARLEAYALIRAVELSNGELPELTGKLKKIRSQAAVWLYKMTENERKEVIEKCEQGKTIAAIYKELTSLSDKEIALKVRRKILEEMRENLENNGICRLSFANTDFRKIPHELRNDVKDGIRNELLAMGAVGIGDDLGTYIMPESNNPDVFEALQQRIESICFDYRKFLIISSDCSNKPVFRLRANDTYYDTACDLLLVLAATRDAINITMTRKKQEELQEKLLYFSKFIKGVVTE